MHNKAGFNVSCMAPLKWTFMESLWSLGCLITGPLVGEFSNIIGYLYTSVKQKPIPVPKFVGLFLTFNMFISIT